MTNPNDPTNDDAPMTEAEARAMFEAMGVEIVGPDQINIIN